MEHSNGLSNGYARNEGKLIADSCIGLKTEDENNVEGKRKEGYSPDIKLPTDFQELLNGNLGDMYSFLYVLHAVNIYT